MSRLRAWAREDSRREKWLEANPSAEDDMDEEALKKRKLLAQCRKLELDEAILRGEFTDNATVTQIAVAWSAQVRWFAKLPEKLAV